MIAVREYRPEDLDGCAQVFMQAFSQSPWDEHWPSLDRTKLYLQDVVATPGFVGLVALEENRICGMLFGYRKQWWDGDNFIIEEMGVDPSVQDRGIGTKLLHQLKLLLRDLHILSILLWTHRDAPARTFYRNHGFEDIPSMIWMQVNNDKV